MLEFDLGMNYGHGYDYGYVMAFGALRLWNIQKARISGCAFVWPSILSHPDTPVKQLSSLFENNLMRV